MVVGIELEVFFAPNIFALRKIGPMIPKNTIVNKETLRKVARDYMNFFLKQRDIGEYMLRDLEEDGQNEELVLKPLDKVTLEKVLTQEILDEFKSMGYITESCVFPIGLHITFDDIPRESIARFLDFIFKYEKFFLSLTGREGLQSKLASIAYLIGDRYGLMDKESVEKALNNAKFLIKRKEKALVAGIRVDKSLTQLTHFSSSLKRSELLKRIFTSYILLRELGKGENLSLSDFRKILKHSLM